MCITVYTKHTCIYIYIRNIIYTHMLLSRARGLMAYYAYRKHLLEALSYPLELRSRTTDECHCHHRNLPSYSDDRKR